MSTIKLAVKKVFSRLGYSLQKKSIVSDASPVVVNSMTDGFERIAQLGITPEMIIDIGAAQGSWTKAALNYWPAAKYELIEPLEEQRGTLHALKVKYPNVSFHLAVAGDAAGETYLNVSPDLDGSGVYGRSDENARKVPIVTVDEIAKNISGSIFIKLDTHGYELPILAGATAALEKTALLIIEVYGFHVSPTCLLFHELSDHLNGLGFRLYDIVDIMRRPGDQAFWQADAFYLRKDNPVFAKKSYA